MTEGVVQVVWGGLMLVLARWLHGRAQRDAWPFSWGQTTEAAKPGRRSYRSVIVFVVRVVGYLSIVKGIFELGRALWP